MLISLILTEETGSHPRTLLRRGQLKKHSTFGEHCVRKIHDWYAGMRNPFQPPRQLLAEDLPPPEIIQPETREWLPHELEDRLYERSDSEGDIIETRSVQRYQFSDVDVVGDQGFIYPTANTVVSVCETMRRISPRGLRRPMRFLRRKAQGSLFHLTGNNHNSHGHFVMQHLPRLMAVRERLLDEPETKLLLAPGHSRWQQFYLGKLGFGPERLLECTRGTLRCEELEYVPFYYSRATNVHEANCNRALRDLFLKEIPESAPRDLFLSRRIAPHRVLLNEDQVYDECKKLWPRLERVELSDYDSEEQLRLFAPARVVIGPFGQSLTNLVYTREPLAMVLFASDTIAGFCTAFRNLALQMGGKGVVLSAGMKEDYRPKTDWIFPLKRLREQLDRLHSLLPDKYR
jgi:hypothetical protein